MTREEAKELLIHILMTYEPKDQYGDYDDPEPYEQALTMAIEALTNVQNMHKGKWIKKQVFNPELDKYVPFIECSVCGYEPYFGGSESKFNYCANCGARMEK